MSTLPPPRGSAEHAEPVGYAGLVTRAVALIVDAIVIDLIAIAAGGVLTLISAVLGGHVHLNVAKAVAGGFLWLVWSGAYLVTFWTLTGQTPGNRLLGVRVSTPSGETVGVARAVRRYFGLLISAIPLGAGFLPVLVDDQRRGLHDRIAHTVVRWYDSDTADAAVAAAASVPSAGSVDGRSAIAAPTGGVTPSPGGVAASPGVVAPSPGGVTLSPGVAAPSPADVSPAPGSRPGPAL